MGIHRMQNQHNDNKHYELSWQDLEDCEPHA